MVTNSPTWTVSDPKNTFKAFTVSGGSGSATYRLGTPPNLGSYYERGWTRYQVLKQVGGIGQSIKVTNREARSSNNYRLCGGIDKYGIDYGKVDYDDGGARAYGSTRNFIEFDYQCLEPCAEGEFRKDPNVKTCTKCSECSSGKYGAADSCSTNGGDRKCVACDAKPDETFYQFVKCSSARNSVWEKCNDACTSNQVELQKCSKDTNQMCVAKSRLAVVETDQATANTGKIATLKSYAEEQIEDLKIQIDVDVTNAISDLKIALTADIKTVTDEFGKFKTALKDAFAAAAGITSTFAYAGNVVDGSGEESAEPAKIKSADGTIKVTIADNSHMTVNDKVVVTADEIKATMDEIVKDTFGSVSESIN
jgi:hypothetical protein